MSATLCDRLFRVVAMALTLVAFPARADSPVYRVEPSLTTAEFIATQFGVFRARGRFARMSGRIAYDQVGAAGSVNFELAATSVTTGWSARDTFIRGEDMFDAERHPVIQFRSTHFIFEDGKPAQIDGVLTLRGVTRPLSLAIVQFDCGRVREDGREICSAEARGTIHRSDFGMDVLVPLIGDDVQLRFEVTAIRE